MHPFLWPSFCAQVVLVGIKPRLSLSPSTSSIKSEGGRTSHLSSGHPDLAPCHQSRELKLHPVPQPGINKTRRGDMIWEKHFIPAPAFSEDQRKLSWHPHSIATGSARWQLAFAGKSVNEPGRGLHFHPDHLQWGTVNQRSTFLGVVLVGSRAGMHPPSTCTCTPHQNRVLEIRICKIQSLTTTQNSPRDRNEPPENNSEWEIWIFNEEYSQNLKKKKEDKGYKGWVLICMIPHIWSRWRLGIF